MTKENSNHYPLVSISEKAKQSMTKRLSELEARVLRNYKLKVSNRKEKK